MNRRSFLKAFAASAVAVVVGVDPLIKASEPLYSVRYIEAFDVAAGELVRRIDISQRELSDPSKYGVKCALYSGVMESQVISIMDSMRKLSPTLPAREVLANLFRELPKEDGHFGISWS